LVLKTTAEKTTNTVRVITSCITFNCKSVNGPPLSWYPMRLAGTWKQYSNKAIPQLISITAKRGRLSRPFICLNLRCPYQANVMKVFDNTRKKMVNKAFFIGWICSAKIYQLP